MTVRQPLLIDKPDDPPVRQPIGVRLDVLLFAGAILIAVLLRFGMIGLDALAPAEAAIALGAVDLTLGRFGSVGPALPETIAAAAFFVFGPSDLAARAGQAIAGIAMVGLMPFFVPHLGRLTAILAAYLIAFSPTVAGVSRRLDGEVWANLAFLLLVLGLLWFCETRREVWATTAAIGAALLVASGPRAITLIVALVAFAAAVRAFGVADSLDGLRALTRPGAPFLAPMAIRALLVGLTVYLVVGSRFFLQPAGLVPVAPTLWLAELNAQGGSGPTGALLALLVYEPLAVIFGITGIVFAFRRPSIESRDPLAVVLIGVWAVAALLIALLNNGELLGPTAAAALPLTLLAATAIADVMLSVRRAALAQSAALLGVLPLLVFAYLVAAQAARQPDAGAPNQRFAIVLAVGLAAGYVILLSYIVGPGFGTVSAVFAAMIVLVANIHMVWTLNAAPSASEWILSEVAEPAGTVALAVARQRSIEEGNAPIGVHPDLRVPMAWYLRDVPIVQTTEWNDRLVAWVAPEGSTSPLPIERFKYAGAAGGPPVSGLDIWRWYVWRDLGRSTLARTAVLHSTIPQ